VAWVGMTPQSSAGQCLGHMSTLASPRPARPDHYCGSLNAGSTFGCSAGLPAKPILPPKSRALRAPCGGLSWFELLPLLRSLAPTTIRLVRAWRIDYQTGNQNYGMMHATLY
jgi:hypothetical protein